jgi:AcrR family transcriptional regulator
MANISNGAFYQFYDTKELLFVEAAKTYEQEMETIFREHIEKRPDKRGVAEGLKAIAAWLRATPWIQGLWQDWPIIARKLPPDFVEKDFVGDIKRIEQFAAEYGVKSRQNAEVTAQIVSILAASTARLDYIPGDGAKAADFIIDAVVDKLFE